MHQSCGSSLYTNIAFYPLNALSTHGMATRISQGTSTPLSELLSLCLSLFSQCSTAVPLCTCPDRPGEESKFELMRNINRLHRRHIHVVLRAVFALWTNMLFNRADEWMQAFWKVEMHRQTGARLLWRESNLWLPLCRAFFCLKVTLPHRLFMQTVI